LQWEGESPGTWEAIVDYIVDRMRETRASWVVRDSMARTTDPFSERGPIKSDYFVPAALPSA
jgi:hypothetical protein